MKIIEEHPELYWDWKGVSRNPNLTQEFISKFPKKSWDWIWIAWNTNLTTEYTEKYRNKNLDLKDILYNPRKSILYSDSDLESGSDSYSFSKNIYTSECKQVENELKQKIFEEM